MTQFKIGDRVRHVGNQAWSKEWQDCVVISAPYGINDYYDVKNSNGAEGALFGKEMEMAPIIPSTDRLVRLEAFVARVAEGGLLAVGFQEEAKSLIAELNPVDPLLIQARRIALDEWQPSAWDDNAWESRVMSGDEDEDRAVRSDYSALRQARKEGNDNGK